MQANYKKQRKNTKFKETVGSRYVSQNQLDKACFRHDMNFRDFKDLTGRTAYKILHHKAFHVIKNPKYDEYERSLASMAYDFFDKKILVVVLKMGTCQTAVSRRTKPIIRKPKERKVQSSLIDSIWGC